MAAADKRASVAQASLSSLSFKIAHGIEHLSPDNPPPNKEKEASASGASKKDQRSENATRKAPASQRRGPDWIPWKDYKNYRGAESVLLVTVCIDHGGPDGDGVRSILCAAADGLAKYDIEQPADMKAKVEARLRTHGVTSEDRVRVTFRDKAGDRLDLFHDDTIEILEEKLPPPERFPLTMQVLARPGAVQVRFFELVRDPPATKFQRETFMRCQSDGHIHCVPREVRLFELSQASSKLRRNLTLHPPSGGARPCRIPGRPAAKGCGACTAVVYAGPCPDTEVLTVGDIELPTSTGDPRADRLQRYTVQRRGTAPPRDSQGAVMVYGGYENGRIAGWSAVSGNLLADLGGHTAPVSTLRCCTGSAIGANLISSSHDGTVRVWRTLPESNISLPGAVKAQSEESECCLFVLEFGSMNPVPDFALLTSNEYLVACCWDGRLRVVDLRRRACANIIEVRSRCELHAVCLYEAKQETCYVYVGTEDCFISHWVFSTAQGAHASTCYELLSWKAHGASVTILNYVDSPEADRRRLFSASEDRSIRMWAPASGTLLGEFPGHVGGISTMCFATHEQLLWTGSRDHSMRSWRLDEAEMRLREQREMAKMDKESMDYEKAVRIAKAQKNRSNKKQANAKTGSKSPRAASKRRPRSARSNT
mmetsp:Transcript_79915/g.151864  ORF Transcript_79915/g.151864 Transcript_79915/m.151864 type:complete len:653 (-) Transcript_79915:74-2032(-)